jgi:hypothetical protein
MPAVARRTPSFGDESFELIDRDELGPPGELDERDVGERRLRVEWLTPSASAACARV